MLFGIKTSTLSKRQELSAPFAFPSPLVSHGTHGLLGQLLLTLSISNVGQPQQNSYVATI